MIEDDSLPCMSNEIAAAALVDFVTELLLSEIQNNPLPVFLESMISNEETAVLLS